jgi:hypothetical protein
VRVVAVVWMAFWVSLIGSGRMRFGLVEMCVAPRSAERVFW